MNPMTPQNVTPEAGHVLYAQAGQLRDAGQYDAAYQAIDQAIAVFEALERWSDAGMAWHRRATIPYITRHLDKALENAEKAESALQKALENAAARERQEILLRQARLDTFYGQFLTEINQYSEAERRLQSALPRLAHHGDLAYSPALNQLAIIYRRYSKNSQYYFDLARRLIHRAIRAARKPADLRWRISAQVNMGRLYELHKEHKLALRWFARVDAPDRMDFCVFQSRCLIGLKRLDEAEAALQAVLTREEERPKLWLAIMARHTLAQLRLAQNDLPAAIIAYEETIAAIESLKSVISLQENWQASFFEDYLPIYEEFVLLCLQMPGRTEQALEYVERSRSRLLLDLLLNRLKIILENEAEYDALRQQADKLYRDLQRLQPVDGQRRAEFEQISAELQAVELRLEPIVYRYQYGDAALSGTIKPVFDPRHWQDVAIGSVVEYFAANQELIAFVLTPDGVRHYYLGSLEPIEVALTALLSRLRRFPEYLTQPDETGRLDGQIGQLLSRLYDQLLAPLAADLNNPLTIIPCGNLHYLPFHALQHNGRSLIEQFNLSYVPSAQILGICRQKANRFQNRSSKLQFASHHQNRSSKLQLASNNQNYGQAEACYSRALLIGGSDARLPHIQREIEQVAALFDKPIVLTGADATRANLFRYASECDYLHIAAHAAFRDDNPLMSFIKLYNETLTTSDIFRLRLNTRLVTLSACETARHHILAGDELLGLMRGFMYAGTPALVLSQWLVDDETAAQLMPQFYRLMLRNGLRPAEALRQAQLDLRKKRPQAYYWAPFVMVGM